ncbi:MAG: thiamine-phosphate kinase, partial [Fibrobacterota bacterium]
YRAMVSNLSDCAAMGALPDSALVQLVFPADTTGLDESVESIYRGFARASERWQFPIVGGDLSSGQVWTLGIALIGSVPPGERVLKRRGVREGDALWVSGRPGESAAGLAVLGRWGRQRAPEMYTRFVQAHISPRPRIREGRVLAKQTGVHAVMDLSDGLSKDVATLCFDNHLGFLFDSAAIRAPESMVRLAEEVKVDWKEWFFHGGEEYELLIAADPDLDLRAQSGLEAAALNRLGSFTREFEGVRIPKPEGGTENLVHRSWDHAKRVL